ncbi:hypothetical protein NQ095_16765 [Rossellomorea sp. SC111]|uniref:hypothetical protein n=1 Tax=Rossellomorea sp. SC111 TaxID=2968985 RepID=UPI00215B5AC8|nr:hypothetical protein [Rossellomorea sp. SC111]MCR8850075.1 hypothetical protein [Rossellomorea sp. SC111]
MNAFKGLLWKDFKTSSIWFYGWIAIVFLIFVIGLVIGHYVHEPSVTQIFLIMIGVFHFAFLPGIVCSMLRVEGKTQLWLHSPHSGFKLLLSKLIIAFIYSTLSLLVVDILGVLTMVIFQEDSLFSYWPIKEGILFNLGVTIVGLYFSGWTIFLWTLYHSLSKYPSLKNIRWIVIAGFIIVYQSAVAFLMSIDWVERLFFETFTVKVSSGFFFSVGANEANAGFDAEMIPFPVMPFLFEGMIMIIVFIISCRLLDRKVEV